MRTNVLYYHEFVSNCSRVIVECNRHFHNNFIIGSFYRTKFMIMLFIFFHYFQTIEWVDKDVDELRSTLFEIRRERKELKKEMKRLRAQIRARKYARPEVVPLRPRHTNN